MKTLKKLLKTAFLALVLFLVLASVAPSGALAANNLTEASMRFSRMTASQVATILVVAKPASTATESQMQITFAAGYTVNGTPANVTISTASLPTTYQGESLSSWPGVGSAASAVNGQTITVASSDLTPGTLYGFYITAGVTNPSSANQYVNTMKTQSSGPVDVDVKDVATRVISDDTVTLYATVSATFNFVLSANQDAFTTTLSTSSIVNTSGVTVTINTNAGSGWAAWLRSQNAGLTSAGASYTITTTGTVNGTPDALSTGVEGYVLDVRPTTDAGGGGTMSINAEYAGNGTTSGGTLSTTLQEIASSTGAANGDVITLVARASISSLTEAASDYTDTYTVVGAGVF